MNSLLTFIFTTNACLTVLGPFTHTPPAALTLDTHQEINMQTCGRADRERCGWFELDESEKPQLYSNEYAVITGYTRTESGYTAHYTKAWRAEENNAHIDPAGVIVPGGSGYVYIGSADPDNEVLTRASSNLHPDGFTNVVWQTCYSNGWVFLKAVAPKED